MSTRKIGNAEVSALGYGAIPVGFLSKKGKIEEEIMAVLDTVYESGATHWDTSDAYGESEANIGKWFKRTGKRNEIFIATKFGFVIEPKEDGRTTCGDPEYAAKAIDRSLNSLGVDYIDLWYLHRPDPTVPIEVTVGAMAEQVKAGKVKYIGLSEASAATLRRAHAVHPITAIQVEYSVFSLDIEDEKYAILRTARELGVKVVAYGPIGKGLLTGSIRSPDDLDKDDLRRIFPRFSAENFPNILRVVDGIKAIADKHKATPGQVALAWLLAQGDDILPIPGSGNPANIKENMAALKLKLSEEEIAEIRKLGLAADLTHVPRYPPPFASLVFVDTPPLK